MEEDRQQSKLFHMRLYDVHVEIIELELEEEYRNQAKEEDKEKFIAV